MSKIHKGKGSGLKVLVIEDNLSTQELQKFILEDAGFLVVTASTAGEAMTILEHPGSKAEASFDACLIDFALPDVTGGILADWIRARFTSIGIVIATGYGRLPAIVDSASRNYAELLTKPIDPEDLINAVIRVIKYPNRRKYPEVKTSSIRHILEIVRTNRKQLDV